MTSSSFSQAEHIKQEQCLGDILVTQYRNVFGCCDFYPLVYGIDLACIGLTWAKFGQYFKHQHHYYL